MILPYLVGILTLVILPLVLSFGLAFFRYDGLSPPSWAGLSNFLFVYTDELFRLSVQNSLALVIIPVPLRVAAAFLLAWLLLKRGRLLTWLRSAIYMPSVIPIAAYALAWLWILNPQLGPVNLLLRSVGIDAPAWFADPYWAKPALALMAFWQIGEGFLVCLAALTDIPPEIEDAARVDGASGGQVLRWITVPLMAPILLLLVCRDMILVFQESFAAVLFTTGGGPYYATYNLPMFIYEKGFDLLLFGAASATMWVLYALTGLIILAVYVIARQWNIGTTDETFVI